MRKRENILIQWGWNKKKQYEPFRPQTENFYLRLKRCNTVLSCVKMYTQIHKVWSLWLSCLEIFTLFWSRHFTNDGKLVSDGKLDLVSYINSKYKFFVLTVPFNFPIGQIYSLGSIPKARLKIYFSVNYEESYTTKSNFKDVLKLKFDAGGAALLSNALQPESVL